MKLSTLILDSLRPTNGWLRPMRAADPKDRWKYYAIRFGFIFLILLMLTVFNVPLGLHNRLR